LSAPPPAFSTKSWAFDECQGRENKENNVNRTRPVRLLALLATAGLFVAACGDDDDSTAGSAPAGSEAPATTVASAATEAPATTAAAGPETTAPPPTNPPPQELGTGTGEGGTIRLWLNGEADTPDAMVEYAVTEFNKIHPDVKVVLERQQWTGIVERQTTALSGNDAPDLVEFGNTQAQAFEAAGALVDLSDKAADLGGDDFLQSLLEAGTYDGKLFAPPYYAGARIMIYRKDLFEKSGIEIPTTLDEMVDAGEKLMADNSDVPNFSGIYLPARNWHAVMSFVWDHGGDIAKQEGDQWVGELDSPESIAGLEFFKDAFDRANAAPADGDDANDWLAFCAGEVGMMPAPGWKPGQIINPDDGCPEMEPNIGVFAMPGDQAGSTAPVFLGGSNLGIPVKSENQDLAYDLLKVLVSAGFQKQFAENGTIPAIKSELASVAGSDAAVAQAKAAENSRFVPTSEKWAGVEAANVLQDMLTQIAQGDDIADAAAQADSAIESTLNA
jgi:N,N'-diacetylchitobiose transport system substrate-binding protein